MAGVVIATLMFVVVTVVTVVTVVVVSVVWWASGGCQPELAAMAPETFSDRRGCEYVEEKTQK